MVANKQRNLQEKIVKKSKTFLDREIMASCLILTTMHNWD